MTDYETVDFPDVADALAEIRRQHEAGEPLVWEGLDRLHHSISAGCPPPSELFSAESLRYAEEDQGQTFWDVYTMVAFQLGFHNGTVREEKHTELWKRDARTWRRWCLEESKGK